MRNYASGASPPEAAGERSRSELIISHFLTESDSYPCVAFRLVASPGQERQRGAHS